MSQAGVSSGWSVVDASAENGGYVVEVQVVSDILAVPFCHWHCQ